MGPVEQDEIPRCGFKAMGICTYGDQIEDIDAVSADLGDNIGDNIR